MPAKQLDRHRLEELRLVRAVEATNTAYWAVFLEDIGTLLHLTQQHHHQRRPNLLVPTWL